MSAVLFGKNTIYPLIVENVLNRCCVFLAAFAGLGARSDCAYFGVTLGLLDVLSPCVVCLAAVCGGSETIWCARNQGLGSGKEAREGDEELSSLLCLVLWILRLHRSTSYLLENRRMRATQLVSVSGHVEPKGGPAHLMRKFE